MSALNEDNIVTHWHPYFLVQVSLHIVLNLNMYHIINIIIQPHLFSKLLSYSPSWGPPLCYILRVDVHSHFQCPPCLNLDSMLSSVELKFPFLSFGGGGVGAF